MVPGAMSVPVMAMPFLTVTDEAMTSSSAPTAEAALPWLTPVTAGTSERELVCGSRVMVPVTALTIGALIVMLGPVESYETTVAPVGRPVPVTGWPGWILVLVDEWC